ncbi:hypothetical protein GCM10025860_19450 [Methanobacterium ferruginis]|nr:hypothetical protein GCM10025860_02350 [Methanobacterium ferruginis]BDZ68497.1 hypothetical protein GCM10025860_19450 [Methanobacterium ferruginis]
MVFFSFVAAAAISAGVKVTEGVSKIGILLTFHDLRVMVVGKVPVVPYMLSIRL